MQESLLELDLLRTFCWTVDGGGIGPAARAVGRTPSAVSLQLRRLEELVATALFLKQGRRLRLTPAGDVLLDYGRRLLALNDEALLATSSHSANGRVRVGLLQDFADNLLPGALANFSRAYPGADLEVRVDRSDRLLQQLRSGDLDLVLLFARQPPAPELRNTRVGSVPMVWIWREKPAPALPLPLILLEAPCVFREAALQTLTAARREWKQSYTTPSVTGTWAAVAAGLGITVRTLLQTPASLSASRRWPGLRQLPLVHVYLVERRSESSVILKKLREALINAGEKLLLSAETTFLSSHLSASASHRSG